MLTELLKNELGFAVFCALVGASYQFARGSKEETFTVAQRISSAVTAIVLMSLIQAFCLIVLAFNFWVVCISGLLLAIGAEKFLRLLDKYYNESEGVIDLIKRVVRVWKIVEEEKSNPKKPGAES